MFYQLQWCMYYPCSCTRHYLVSRTLHTPEISKDVADGPQLTLATQVDPTLPDAVISSQAGILHASFTAAQFLTAMLWGRVADSQLAGRKTVILIGLLGTCKPIRFLTV